jgi:hypothetical protein
VRNAEPSPEVASTKRERNFTPSVEEILSTYMITTHAEGSTSNSKPENRKNLLTPPRLLRKMLRL